VFSPALERHVTPVHSVSVPSAPSVTDFGGAIVRHSVDVIALGPKLASISQLMFFEGEKNSVPVDVWGTSVPEVCGALDVVERVVVGVAAEVVVVVGDEVGGDGLLEQAARAVAPDARISTLTGHFHSASGIGRAYGRIGSGSGLSMRGQGSTARA
jgi:hypothetical protein